MNSIFRCYKKLLFLLCTLPVCAVASPLTVTLPAETVILRPSDLPGYAVAQQKCGICHSADYIEYQPPGFNLKQWTGLAKKMKEAYGAPLSDDDVNIVGEYLAATYSGENASIRKIKAVEIKSMADNKPATLDVKEILAKNACLGCHAIDQKVVGPAYHDVAMRYKGNAEAISQVIDHISHGGSGRWGEIPMPPFPGLQSPELKLLAEFVLAQ